MSIELVRSGLNHWLLDALGGTKMQVGIRGKNTTFTAYQSGASLTGVFTVAADGKVYITGSYYGGKVSHVRGVWLSSVDFTWEGYWATTSTPGAIDYYSSHSTLGLNTTITLNDTLAVGTEVQVFYYYESDQVLAAETYYNSYPYLFKAYGGPFPEEYSSKVSEGWFSSAADGEYWYIVACYEAYLHTGKEYYKDMAVAIIEKCREYETASKSYVETFDYALGERPDGVWAVSEYGTGVGTTQMDGSVATDPNDVANYVYHIQGQVGVWGLWGKYLNISIPLNNKFQFRFKGSNLASRAYASGIIVITLTMDDNTRYSRAFVDDSTAWKSFTYDGMYAYFVSEVNHVYTDIAPTWITPYFGTNILASYVELLASQSPLSAAKLGFFDNNRMARLAFDFDSLADVVQNYAGFRFGVPDSCTDFSGYFKATVFAEFGFNTTIVLKDTLAVEYSYDYSYRDTVEPEYISIPMSSFSPSAVGAQITQITFALKNTSVWYNVIRWQDKFVGDMGGTWKNTSSTIAKYENTTTGSFTDAQLTMGTSILYSKVDRIVVSVNDDYEWDPVLEEYVKIADGYAGFMFNVPTGVDSGDYSNLRFVFKCTKALSSFKSIVKDANGVGFEQEHSPVPANQVIAVNRLFSGMSGLVHPIQSVQFETRELGDYEFHFGMFLFGDYLSTPSIHQVYVGDIMFGVNKVHPDGGVTPVTIKQYEFNFPPLINSISTSYPLDVYFDDVGIDYTPVDDYAGLPYKSYQWGDAQKKGGWVGPLYLGYLVPSAYAYMGYSAEAVLAVQCVLDSQVEFASVMGRGTAKSLFMPCHTRAVPEGTEFSDNGESNVFSFGEPDSTQMEWGGWQYRISAQLAHYYYVSGNSNAQDVLQYLTTWLDSVIVLDGSVYRIPVDVKRNGLTILEYRAAGSEYIRITGAPSSETAWLASGDILYIENDTTKYTVTNTVDTNPVGETAIYLSPVLAADSDVGEKVLCIETSSSAPHEKGLLAQTFILHYMRSGSDTSLLWYRRMLDDLIAVQLSNGSFPSGSSTYSFHQAEIGKAFGFLISGVPGITPVHPLVPTSSDEAAFASLYSYVVNNSGTAKPCSLNSNGIPLHIHEDKAQFIESGATISNTATTTEAISLSMHFALLWSMSPAATITSSSGVVAVDNYWLQQLRDHLYHVTIGGVITDIEGGGEVIPPEEPQPTVFSVYSTSPYGGETGVAINAVILVSFSQAANAATIGIASFTVDDGAPVSGIVAVAGDGLTATFTPDVDMAASTAHTCTLAVTITDVAGFALEAEYVWSFTTGTVADTTAPTVVSVSPLASAIAAIDTKITATFSETIDWTTLTGNFTLYQGATSITGNISYNGVTATFTPHSPLAYGTVYGGTVNTNVKDLVGNAVAVAYEWQFTTDNSPDATAPTVLSTAPADTATGVAKNTAVVAYFSEDIDSTTVIAGTSFTLKAGATPVAGTTSTYGSVVTFTPDVALSDSTVYTATLTTAVKDLAGNALAGSYIWTFTTGITTDTTAPTVSSVTPVNGTGAVPIDSVITATFSEAMDVSTFTASSVIVFSAQTQILGGISYSEGVMTFTPSTLLHEGTAVSATLTTAIKDISGNAMALDYVWYFSVVKEADTVNWVPGTNGDFTDGEYIGGAAPTAPEKRIRIDVDIAMLDSYIHYTGAATVTVGGLWHLNGESVVAIADGAIITGLVVENGIITLDTAASEIYIGKQYTGTIHTNRFDYGPPDNTHGLIQRVIAIGVRATDTGTFKFGLSEDDLLVVNPKDHEGDEVDYVTGDILNAAFPGRFIKNSGIFIIQDLPIPTTINAITQEVEIGIK